ncbi:hypothetical protein [Lacrimispora brassicae]
MNTKMDTVLFIRHYKLLKDYTFGGDFERTLNFPGFYEFVEIEIIQVDGAERYNVIGDISLGFFTLVSFERLEYFKELSYKQVEMKVKKSEYQKIFLSNWQIMCAFV